MNINDFKTRKENLSPISMITCYDYWSATLISQTDIDTILVGDSLGMVSHGFTSTLPVDVDLMVLHTAAVRRGAPDKFIVTDLPFLSHRKSIDSVIDSVSKIMKAGANAVKIEGIDGHEETIRFIVESGVPVMGHLGLTPQSFNAFGGFKVQSKSKSEAEKLERDAKKLQELGCFAVVLECIPDSVGTKVSKALNIPTIGIGAGKDTDGQVLVLQDMLGVNTGYTPKFVRKFIDGASLITNAISEYDNTVKNGSFPTKKESYGG
ncbi:MAG: 3-methyl-2-oxobutanoate hydroxymethyltransferase [Spirochaetaceae bacterium 4572_7]|nr:MAG: 3-methyl-2-oxobutanoate hydroxymethyltransferase [Spirochaetaceae bacterium 4572_7]